MRWHSVELQGGWVLLAVDVNFSDENSPEKMAGVRCAVHPADVYGRPALFWATISEMQVRAVAVAQPLPAPRARAFDVRLHRLPKRHEG